MNQFNEVWVNNMTPEEVARYADYIPATKLIQVSKDMFDDSFEVANEASLVEKEANELENQVDHLQNICRDAIAALEEVQDLITEGKITNEKLESEIEDILITLGRGID